MEIKPGIYRHYKNGKDYEVVGIATHTETGESLVVYRGLYTDPELGLHPLFVRPKKMFLEKVEVNGIRIPRFQLI